MSCMEQRVSGQQRRITDQGAREARQHCSIAASMPWYCGLLHSIMYVLYQQPVWMRLRVLR
jgi:hypothetical protein